MTENTKTDAEDTIEDSSNRVTYGEVLEGKIVKINLPRGYGFILCADRPYVKFFFHWTNLRPDTIRFDLLNPGDKVRFTEAVSVKGHRAVQISLLK